MTFLVNWWDRKPRARYCISIPDSDAARMGGGPGRVARMQEMLVQGAGMRERHGETAKQNKLVRKVSGL